MVFAIWKLQRSSCLLKTEASFSNSAFSMFCITRSLCNSPTFSSPTYSYLLYVVIKYTYASCLWCPCCIKVYLGFCCPNSLDVWKAFLYSSKFICICFPLLYAFFLCLSLARSSIVICAGLLAFLPSGTALEFGGGNLWTLTSYLGPVFPSEGHWDLSKHIFGEARVWFPEV